MPDTTWYPNTWVRGIALAALLLLFGSSRIEVDLRRSVLAEVLRSEKVESSVSGWKTPCMRDFRHSAQICSKRFLEITFLNHFQFVLHFYLKLSPSVVLTDEYECRQEKQALQILETLQHLRFYAQRRVRFLKP